MFAEEFKQLVAEGHRAAAVDHPPSARSHQRHAPGAITPRAMVADNDLALGQLVELISHSAIWKEAAIFVLEDDAQNGPDHVDAHRSILFAISPFSAAASSTARSTRHRACCGRWS